MSKVATKQITAGASEAQGDVLYFNGTEWVRLAAGTSGQFLQTQGAAADPQWATPAGGGNVSGPAVGGSTDNAITRWDGVSGTLIQDSTVLIDDSGNISQVNSLDLTELASDPASPSVGQVWFNTTAELYRGRRNIGGADFTVPIRATLDNLSASADPGATDDVNSGYEVGSVWVNTTLGEKRAFVCVDNTASGAVWRALVNNGTTHGDVLYFNGSQWVRLAPGTSGQVLQTNGSGSAPSWVTPSSGSAFDTFQFKLNGKISTSTSVDGAWIAPRAGTITRVTLFRRTAGGGGSTVVDVNKNGTTIYTTQGNRPTVTAASGNNQIDATTDFDVTTFAQNDRFQWDIDSVETGNPLDASMTIEVQYT